MSAPLVSLVLPFSAMAMAPTIMARALIGREVSYEVITFLDEGWGKGRRGSTRAQLSRLSRRVQRGSRPKPVSAPFLAVAYNDAAARARGRYLVLLDDCTTVEKNWLAPLIARLEGDPRLAIAAPVPLWHGESDCFGFQFNTKRATFSRVRTVAAAATADVVPLPFVVRTDVFRTLEGLAPRMRDRFFMAADLCLRLRSLGYKIAMVPRARVVMLRRRAPEIPAKVRRPFQKTWLEEQAIHTALHTPSRRSLSRGRRLVVYTAITNNYDALKEVPRAVGGASRFVAFVDEKTRAHAARSETWKLEPLTETALDPTRVAKRPKVLPHLYFPDDEYSLWIDGSVSLRMPFPVDHLVSLYLRDVDLCILQHTRRHCTYAEAAICVERRLDDPAIIAAQMRRYRRAGLPRNAGLAEATIILRRHTRLVRRFDEAWWDEINRGSRRDQLSFMYTARKVGLAFGFFSVPELFARHPHL